MSAVEEKKEKDLLLHRELANSYGADVSMSA